MTSVILSFRIYKIGEYNGAFHVLKPTPTVKVYTILYRFFAGLLATALLLGCVESLGQGNLLKIRNTGLLHGSQELTVAEMALTANAA